jgi:hypothetical protein
LWKSWGQESVERDTERGREREGEGTFWLDHYGVESFGRMGDLSGEEASYRSWRTAKREETRRHGERDCALWVGLSFFLSFFDVREEMTALLLLLAADGPIDR